MRVEDLLLSAGTFGVIFGLGSYFANLGGTLSSEFYNQYCFGNGVEISNQAFSILILGACLKSYFKKG